MRTRSRQQCVVARLMLLMQTSRLISNLKSENEALKDELERMRQGNAANAMPDSTAARFRPTRRRSHHGCNIGYECALAHACMRTR